MSHFLLWVPQVGDRVTLLTPLPFPYRWGRKQNRGRISVVEGPDSFLVRPDHARFDVHVLRNEVSPLGRVVGLPLLRKVDREAK